MWLERAARMTDPQYRAADLIMIKRQRHGRKANRARHVDIPGRTQIDAASSRASGRADPHLLLLNTSTA
jgi:hypothetical protein